jgi:hypothetical protein
MNPIKFFDRRSPRIQRAARKSEEKAIFAKRILEKLTKEGEGKAFLRNEPISPVV